MFSFKWIKNNLALVFFLLMEFIALAGSLGWLGYITFYE